MGDVDDAFVERLRVDLTDEAHPILGTPLAASTASRTLTVLREAAREWARARTVPAAIDRTPRGPTRRVGSRRERPVPTLGEISDLLLVSPTHVRAAIALAVGGGLTEREILLLRRGHLSPADRRVVLLATVPGVPRDGRRIRYAWLPVWAMDLVRALHPRLRSMPAGAFLFPSPSHWDRPRSGFHAALARACADALGEEGPCYTLGDLRRSWQAFCRAHRMPRAVVRRSWGVWAPMPGRRAALPEGVRALQRLMGGWRTLGDDSGQVLVDPSPVPRQAAKGTAPGEPEPVSPKWAVPPELPPSCLV
jgi:hypothetical protein